MNKFIVFSCIALGLAASSPSASSSDAKIITEYGTPTVFNGQEARAYFTHKGREILALGVEVPAALYEGAPMDPPTDGKYDVPVDADDPTQGVAWYCCGYEIVLDLPQAALAGTAFRHVVLNWNPKGHPPPGIYEIPHTDFHFYFMTDEERLSIGGARDSRDMCMVPDASPDLPLIPSSQNCEQFALTAADVPPEQMPAGYVNVGATEPAMGNHLIDPDSHEFHGQSFDHTFIYMTHAGQLTGMEPMITLDFLRGLTEPVRVAIPMPEAFPLAGSYPTEYVMEYDRGAGMFRIYYTQWKTFPASKGDRITALPTPASSTVAAAVSQ